MTWGFLPERRKLRAEMSGSTATTDGVSETESHHGDEEHHHRSRWPVIAALGAGTLYFGLALYTLATAAGVAPAWLGLGLVGAGTVGLGVGLLGWIYEGFLVEYWDHDPDSERHDAYRTTMILFLLTDVSTFSAGFIYYAFIRAGTWPPAELPHHLLGPLVLINTGLLVLSSITLHGAHMSLERDNRTWFLGLLGVTVGLGVVFLGGQALEYYEFVTAEGFTLTSGLFASAFYGLTGLHGLHVALGVVFLGIVFARALKGQYSSERDTSVSTVSLYWHFVDVVWLFLVLVVYVGA